MSEDVYVGGEEGVVEEAMPKLFGEFFDRSKLFIVLAILTVALCVAVLLHD